MRNLELVASALAFVLGALFFSGVIQAQEATGVANQAVAEQGSDQAALGQSTMDQAVSPQNPEAAGASTSTSLPRRNLVMTEKDLRVYRLAMWEALLKGDMKDVYKAYGAPSTRYRESTMDRVVEKWVYADLGKVFSFEDGKLVDTTNFMPGSILSYGEFPTGIIVSR